MFSRYATTVSARCGGALFASTSIRNCSTATPSDVAAAAQPAAAVATTPPSAVSQKKLKKKGTLHPSLRPKAAGSSSAPSPSTSWFAVHRERTLRDLATNSNDKSNAGGVDPLIRPAVDLINSYPHFCTASSCSGRVSVFHRAMPTPGQIHNKNAEGGASAAEGQQSDLPMDVVIANKKRGTGLGTVFSSHDPLTDPRAVATQVYKDLVAARVPITRRKEGKEVGEGAESSSPHALAELLQVKFEPTILHTTCATMADAHQFIGASSDSGHRSTGIVVSRAGREEKTRRAAPPSPSSVEAAAEGMGSSAAAADANSSSSSEDGEASGEGLEAVGAGWKITAKMQSMINFDAPLYTATSGWTTHGGHLPLPDVFASAEGGVSAEDQRIAAAVIDSIERLLRHGNALFEENAARRERFIVALKEAEALAERRKKKH